MLFSFYLTCVRRKMISALHGWRNTNLSGFYNVILQVTQGTAYHFKTLKCSSRGFLLHL